MLDKIPDIEGIDIAVHYNPASTVGGDFYDILKCQKGHAGFIVGDVSGKGLLSALFLVRFMREFQKISVCKETLTDIMKKTNEMVCDKTQNGTFITMVFMIYNPENRLLLYTNAGHPPPLLWNSETETFSWLNKASVPPLGISRDMSIEVDKIQLTGKDCLVLYTDGLVEARNYEGRLYGFKRLEKVIRKTTSNAREIIEKIVSDLDSFNVNPKYRDDLTILTFCVKDQP